jgi:hypothetical protein
MKRRTNAFIVAKKTPHTVKSAKSITASPRPNARRLMIRLSEARKLAEEHAECLFNLLRKIYVEAFEHGYKHGWDDYYAMVKEETEN